MSYISKKPSLLGSYATLISLQLWHAPSFIAFLQRSLHEACWAGVQRRMVDVVACTAEHDAIWLGLVHPKEAHSLEPWKARSRKYATVSNVQATAK